MTRSETLVYAAATRQLQAEDIVIRSVRISDSLGGDVEIDLLLLLPGFGVAVVEVKGGQLIFRGGQWSVRTLRGERRTNPVQQARRAKHALRRYIERQPSWTGGRLRVQWFVAAPFTDVNQDFGPEGPRQQLLGKHDLDTMVSRIKETLGGPAIPEPRLSSDDAHALKYLLENTAGQPAQQSRARRIALAAICAGLLLVPLVTWVGKSHDARCTAGYAPCIPPKNDYDCSDLRELGVIRVNGKDPYHLDADGDGKGCEWNARPSAAP